MCCFRTIILRFFAVPYSDSELLALGIDLTREKSSGTRGSSYDTPPPAPNNAYENEIYGGTTSAQYGRFCAHLIVCCLIVRQFADVPVFARYAFENEEWNCQFEYFFVCRFRSQL